ATKAQELGDHIAGAPAGAAHCAPCSAATPSRDLSQLRREVIPRVASTMLREPSLPLDGRSRLLTRARRQQKCGARAHDSSDQESGAHQSDSLPIDDAAE